MPEFLKETLGRYYGPYIPHLIRIAGMVVVSIFILRLIDSVVRRLGRIVPSGDLISVRGERRVQTLGSVIRSVAKVVLLIFVGLTAAEELGYNIAPALTISGIAGVAIGFGAQSLVKDVIAGFVILFEDQYGVGDVIRIGTLAGEVEQMTLRTTTLRNTEGHVHVVPNGSIQTVTVLTKDWARAVVDVVLAYKENVESARQVLEIVGERLHEDWNDRVLERPSILGIESMGTDGVTIRCIVKTQPKKQWEVMREWRQRIKEEFERQGIGFAATIPQTVWIQNPPAPKTNTAKS